MLVIRFIAVQTLLAPLVGNRNAIGNVRRVRRLGFGHQLGDLRLQLRLDLARVFIRQCAVSAGVGMDFRAVEPDRPLDSGAGRREVTPMHGTHIKKGFESVFEPSTIVEGGGQPPTLAEVGSGCRWPVGTNQDGLHTFCGQPISRRSYCLEHHAQAHRQEPGQVLGPLPSRSRDNCRSSREGRAPRSPPPRSEPDASPAATRQPMAATITRSADQSCGSCSSTDPVIMRESMR